METTLQKHFLRRSIFARQDTVGNCLIIEYMIYSENILIFIPVTSMGSRHDRVVGTDSDWRGTALETEVDWMGHHTQTQEDDD